MADIKIKDSKVIPIRIGISCRSLFIMYFLILSSLVHSFPRIS